MHQTIQKAEILFFKTVHTLIEEKSLGQLILGGDHNEILSQIDSKSKTKQQKNRKKVHNLNKLIKSLKLNDV